MTPWQFYLINRARKGDRFPVMDQLAFYIRFLIEMGKA